MTNHNARPTPNKLLIAAAFAAVFAVAGSAFVLYYLGTFSKVSIQKMNLPEYRFAYVMNTGPYNKIDDVFNNVKKELKKSNAQSISAMAIFLDDPSVVPGDQLRSKVGFIISRYDQVFDSLQVEVLQSIAVVQAQFKGSPVVGSSKAYKAMKNWCLQNGYIPSLPSVEVYLQDGHIEYHLPINKKQQES